jgi:uncharacterized protein (DUF302 family)
MTTVTAQDIGIPKTVDYSFEEAIEKVTARLKEQGFGILTEIDVKATLKQKINVDFKRYTILGACNPPFAHKALEAEPMVGLMMPCNVIVYETDDGKIQVTGFNPQAMLATFGRDDLTDIASQMGTRLKTAIEGL